MAIVYSTCTCDNVFPRWSAHDRVAGYDESVVILGGANVQNKRTLITPRGVVTTITDEQADFLENNVSFKAFVESGHMFLDRKAKEEPSARRVDKTVEENLEASDNAAQDTAETYAELGKKAPESK